MKLMLTSAAMVAAILVASPVLAGGYKVTCTTETNISYERGGEKNPTQTCTSLAACPTPSMFASLSGQVSNAANDAPDTHYKQGFKWDWKHKEWDLKWTGSEHEGACGSHSY